MREDDGRPSIKPVLKRHFVDGHVHVGRAGTGEPIKIAAAKSLTLEGILREASTRKGMDIIGVIDGVTGPVQRDLKRLIELGDLWELPEGGLRYRDETTLLIGVEIEVAGPRGGAAHFGVFVPSLRAAAELYQWLKERQTNPDLSSQRVRATNAQSVADKTQDLGGLFIVNHAFTPHKGLYGTCVERMADMVSPQAVAAVELGLSADTEMADRLSELAEHTFVTNSDAHSLPKIAREYHVAELASSTFASYRSALRRVGVDRIALNVGLVPTLGKYHGTACPRCKQPLQDTDAVCPHCGQAKLAAGVAQRLRRVADRSESESPDFRPPYRHQIPLEFIPGLGKRALERLLAAFGTEMAVLHDVPVENLADEVGLPLARSIDLARTGRFAVMEGAGGRYGRMIEES